MTENELKFFRSSRHYAATLKVLKADMEGITTLASNITGKIEEKDIEALIESQDSIARLFTSFANEIRGMGKAIHDQFDPDCHCMDGYVTAEVAVESVESKMPSTPEELEAKERKPPVEIKVVALDDANLPPEVKAIIAQLQTPKKKPEGPPS